MLHAAASCMRHEEEHDDDSACIRWGIRRSMKHHEVHLLHEEDHEVVHEEP